MFHDFYHIVLLAAGIYLLLLLFTWLIYRHFTRKLKEQEGEKMKSILEAQENERQGIAREVHDNLGPLLSITNMQIETQIENTLNERDRGGLSSIHQQLREAIILCRSISHDLAPYMDKSDLLEEVLSDYIKRINQSKKLRVIFDYSAAKFTMGDPIAVSLCRILLEMINNTIRHARATEIKISLCQSEKQLVTEYSDNGVGFSDSVTSSGIGIKNITSRVQLLKGGIQYYPKSEKYGMRAVIQIPLNNGF